MWDVTHASGASWKRLHPQKILQLNPWSALLWTHATHTVRTPRTQKKKKSLLSDVPDTQFAHFGETRLSRIPKLIQLFSTKTVGSKHDFRTFTHDASSSRQTSCLNVFFGKKKKKRLLGKRKERLQLNTNINSTPVPGVSGTGSGIWALRSAENRAKDKDWFHLGCVQRNLNPQLKKGIDMATALTNTCWCTLTKATERSWNQS